MVMVRVVATPDELRADSVARRGGFPILLYRGGEQRMAGLGHRLPLALRQLPGQVSTRAWDFLSIAIAVFGADRFLLRHHAADGWTRVISLEVDLVEPDPWIAESSALARMLRFMTGDIWELTFQNGGKRPPRINQRAHDFDCVCLFSGGMDSFLGAANLVHSDRRPLLVSQATQKEGPYQQDLARVLRQSDRRFSGRVIERFNSNYERSTRSRSMLFLAYGLLAASALDRDDRREIELLVPENGFISINPPMTRRRIGSLSTRTTHPHFLSSLQDIITRAGLHTRIYNPFRFKTKGEMITECVNEAALRCLSKTYSCGKGKRINMHCGRCLPCLIRRAAFRASGTRDGTAYRARNLSTYGTDEDIFECRLATESSRTRDMSKWALEAGPLPTNAEERSEYVAVVGRGFVELRNFLNSVRWR